MRGGRCQADWLACELTGSPPRGDKTWSESFLSDLFGSPVRGRGGGGGGAGVVVAGGGAAARRSACLPAAACDEPRTLIDVIEDLAGEERLGEEAAAQHTSTTGVGVGDCLAVGGAATASGADDAAAARPTGGGGAAGAASAGEPAPRHSSTATAMADAGASSQPTAGAAGGRATARSRQHPSALGVGRARSRSPARRAGAHRSAAAGAAVEIVDVEAVTSPPAPIAGGGAAAVEVVDAEEAAFFFPAFQPMGDAERQQTRASRWVHAEREAEGLVAAALRQHGPAVAAAHPWLQLPEEALLRRVAEETARATRRGGWAYIGSTSDPGWRWGGGWYLPSEKDGKHHYRKRYLPGHRLAWKTMLVVGCWRDAVTAEMETKAIEVGRQTAPGRLKNKASDARGLEIRSWSHSFVYICSGFKS